EVREPVIVKAKAGMLQFGITESEERHPERCIEHFSFHAINVLVLDSFGRVPSARACRLIAPFHVLLEFLAAAASAEATRYRERRDVRTHEYITGAAMSRNYPRSTIFEPLTEAVDEEVCRLHHVRIG